MTDEQRFNSFIQQLRDNRKMWLLQAGDGLFAMLEDEQDRTFLPVWSAQDSCQAAADAEWNGYTATEMSVTEMLNWCDELAGDEIQLGIEPQNNGNILPLPAEVFKNIFSRL